MNDRCEILACALGDVWLCHSDDRSYYLVISDALASYQGDLPLPGGKFTAREFLEHYLRRLGETIGWPKVTHWTHQKEGTLYFTPESVEMAQAALEEWGK